MKTVSAIIVPVGDIAPRVKAEDSGLLGTPQEPQ